MLLYLTIYYVLSVIFGLWSTAHEDDEILVSDVLAWSTFGWFLAPIVLLLIVKEKDIWNIVVWQRKQNENLDSDRR